MPGILGDAGADPDGIHRSSWKTGGEATLLGYLPTQPETSLSSSHEYTPVAVGNRESDKGYVKEKSINIAVGQNPDTLVNIQFLDGWL